MGITLLDIILRELDTCRDTELFLLPSLIATKTVKQLQHGLPREIIVPTMAPTPLGIMVPQVQVLPPLASVESMVSPIAHKPPTAGTVENTTTCTVREIPASVS